MREGITVEVGAAEGARLEAIVADWNSPHKHVWRARIVLLTADGWGTNEIMRQAGTSKVTVWRWQERFMRAGVEDLLRAKTRCSRIAAPSLPGRAPGGPASNLGNFQTALWGRITPPLTTTYWTAAMIAKAVGISISSVQRIWQARGLRPYRVRRFKLSRDPEPKHGDIVGPPAHAIVLRVDEKSQIQALDRTQPGLPLIRNRSSGLPIPIRSSPPSGGVTSVIFDPLIFLSRQKRIRERFDG